MPRTRATITSSSRVMLVAYPMFFFAIAYGYIFGSPTRTSEWATSPAVIAARGHLDFLPHSTAAHSRKR